MLSEIRGATEECGVFGIWGVEDTAAQLTFFGLHSLQHRGEHGAGIVTKNGNELIRQRGMGLVSDVFTKEHLDNLRGSAAIGHVRNIIEGRNRATDTQPFLFQFENLSSAPNRKFEYSSMSLCHNGNIVNYHSLRRELEQQGSIFHSNSDSEVLAHLIKCQHNDTFVENVKAALCQIKGAFAYLILTPTELIAALDPCGLRPLCIGRLGKAFVVASETCALDTVGASFYQDVKPGELVIISDAGMTVESYTDQTTHALCSMEFMYFARPDSDIYGVNVHTARKNMGKVLATEAPVEADVVTAAPDSGVSAAIGYAEAMGIPYELGLIKNRYVSRTFIQPSQELRELGVKMKLSAVRGVVNNKRVVVVDDSIVRGTTTKHVVQLVRDAGATEVHVRIPAPIFKYPGYYGVDPSALDELIGHNRTVEEICEMIGADSLGFLSIDGLVDSINLPFTDKYKGLCVAYFNGDYPTELGDYAL